MVDLTRSTQEWLHPALIGQGMCPDCACPQEQHGTFGWTGCDQRFDADVLAPRRSYCCDCHREFWGQSVRCPDCYAAALAVAETCACGEGTVGLVQREGDRVTRHHALLCGWEQDAGVPQPVIPAKNEATRCEA